MNLESTLISEKDKHKNEVEKFSSIIINLEANLRRAEGTYVRTVRTVKNIVIMIIAIYIYANCIIF